MKTITDVTALEGLELLLTFSDGIKGTLDFSREPLTGVFSAWLNPEVFRSVTIGERGRTLVWSCGIDLCADSLWLEVTGNKPEDIFPVLKELTIHA